MYLPRNARILLDALRLGDVRGLSRGEIDAHASFKPDDPSMWRAWEYWARRAGCGDLLSAGRPGTAANGAGPLAGP